MMEIIVELVAARAGITKGAARKAIRAFADVIPELVGEYDRVRVPRLGIFSKKILKPRNSRDPYKGKTVAVGATAGLRFKPSRNVRRKAQAEWVPEEYQ